MERNDIDAVVLARFVVEGAKALAQELGCSPSHVTRTAKRLGLRRPKKADAITEEMRQAIRDRYHTDGSKALAKELGIPYTRVQDLARRMNVKQENWREGWCERRRRDNTSVNLEFFDTWSIEMAWVLGLTFADGNIQRDMRAIRYDLHRQDEEVLDQVKALLKSTRAIYRYEVPNKASTGTHPKSLLVVSSALLTRVLVEKHGCHPRKSYRDDPFPDVPVAYLPHFVRGYFDGDGTIYRSHRSTGLSFVGSRAFITSLRDRICAQADVPVTRLTEKDNYSRCTWTNRPAIQKILMWMYPAGNYPHGQRKLLKAQHLLGISLPSV